MTAFLTHDTHDMATCPCSKCRKQSLNTDHHINVPSSSMHAPHATAQEMLMAYTHHMQGLYGQVHGLCAQHAWHEGDEGWQQCFDLEGEEGGPPCLRGP
jgi:hypothetical protein